MKQFELRLTKAALQDLNDIYQYVGNHHSEADANFVFDRIVSTMNDLAAFPDRGAKLTEIEALERRQYRQVFFKPYRIVYSVVGSRVYVHLIADGRRDFRSLLAQRLLR